jgi:hypothetical protein
MKSRTFKKLWWIVLFVLVLAGGGYYGYYRWQQTQTAAAQTETLQTATARQGDLVIRASASGTPGPFTNGGQRNFGEGGPPEGVPGEGFGGGPGGGYPGGGGDYAGGGQGFDPQQMATAQARGTPSARTRGRIPTPLLNALIELLQERAQQ